MNPIPMQWRKGDACHYRGARAKVLRVLRDVLEIQTTNGLVFAIAPEVAELAVTLEDADDPMLMTVSRGDVTHLINSRLPGFTRCGRRAAVYGRSVPQRRSAVSCSSCLHALEGTQCR